MKFKNLIYGGLACLFLLTQVSCDVINPEEEIPSYLIIEDFTVGSNPDVEALSLSSKIVAANVIVNNETQGVITLPGKIPVFAEGDVTVTLDPLVQENGSADLLQIYPFFKRIDIPANLSFRDSTTISVAETEYISNALIRGSDFSASNVFFTEDLDGNILTEVNISSGGQAGEGTVGRIVLTEDNPLFDGATASGVPIEVNSIRQAWLEVQYKTDVDLVFGFRDLSNPTGVQTFREFGVRAKDEWNTLYFDATNLLVSQNITKFQITLTAQFLTGSTAEESIVLIDNVKLIYTEN